MQSNSFYLTFAKQLFLLLKVSKLSAITLKTQTFINKKLTYLFHKDFLLITYLLNSLLYKVVCSIEVYRNVSQNFFLYLHLGFVHCKLFYISSKICKISWILAICLVFSFLCARMT